MTVVATGHKGIDVRQTANRLIFRVLEQDSSGVIIATGTVTLMLLESQSDGTYKTYDFNDNTFKATSCTTPTVNMNHQTANAGAVNTGLWTYVLTTLTGFTAAAIYKSVINLSTASPVQQVREWQFGAEQGDDTLAGTDGKALVSANAQDLSATLSVNAKLIAGATPGTQQTGDAYAQLNTLIPQALAFSHVGTAYFLKIDLQSILGTALTETLGHIADGVSKFFDLASHVGTHNGVPAAVPGAAGGLPTLAAGAAKLAQTVDLTAGQTIAATVSGGAVEANVETHVSNVLNAAIPGSPTGNSVYDYIKNKLSQYAGGDTAGTTTLLGRIIGTLLTGNHSPQSGDSFAVVKSGGTGDLVALKAVTPASVIAAKSDLPSVSGLAVEANVQGHVTDALNAAMPGTPTSGSAFDRIKSYLNASVSAIKTITDQFRFTIANQVDANAVSGGGTPPTPAQISAVVTPDVRAGIIADHGAGAYGPGGTGGAYTLTFTLRDSVTALPIEAAQTELYSDAGLTVLVSSLPTNLFGIAAFGNLINGTYYVKAIKTGYTTNSFTVVVSGNSSASGTLVAIVPVPVTPTLTKSLADQKRGDTWDFDITVGNLTGYTSLWLTLKNNANDQDAQSILQIKLNASGSGGGLLYVNGAPASNAALASLTITSLANGTAHCHVDQSITAQITPRTYQCDSQTLIGGNTSTPISLSQRVTDDVTRAIA